MCSVLSLSKEVYKSGWGEAAAGGVGPPAPTNEDPMEKGCLGEGQTRSNEKFPALPSPL